MIDFRFARFNKFMFHRWLEHVYETKRNEIVSKFLYAVVYVG